jgi:lipopolysaccharide/colanic/teichoic acid biosynthesis glycosyltransferase
MLRTSQKFYLFWKRCIDIFGSFLGIVLLSPVLLICAIVTKCTSKGPVFFKQERIGKHEKPFKLLKFRSMRVDAPEIAPADMSPEEQAKLVTKWGGFMRKTSLDEIPQLFNIFVGQMSFIGPRPSQGYAIEAGLIDMRRSYTPSVYEIKPGISGYAQVVLHREHNEKKKAECDAYYVLHFSLWLDTKLFLRTIFGIFGDEKGR